MHFITFPVASTNIFPLSNSTKGGQLVTEFNLKAREMVATNPAVKYPIGPSFIHCAEDFKVKLLEDSDVAEYDKTKLYDRGDYCRYGKNANTQDTYICIKDITSYIDPEDPEHKKHTDPTNATYWTKTSVSTSILQIGPGRAVINGHYVETLAPMQIDLNMANAELAQQSQDQLYGNLSIGIKSYFSTENTMAGSMLVENTDNMYVGIQLVVTQRDDFKTPEDSPEDQDQVTADLKLADFTYVNGVISSSSITPNPNAMRYIPSDRIRDFSSLLDDKYVSSENLVSNYIYTYSGDGVWCNSISNLMVWDKVPNPAWVAKNDRGRFEPPTVGEAQFLTDRRGNVHLVLPHKQPDGETLNAEGKCLYYPDKDIPFPTANYTKSTSGIVTAEYTQVIKDLDTKLKTYKQFTNGKQIAYWDSLTMDAEGNYNHEFPKNLESKGYNIGDYILVREDYTASPSEDEGTAPSTMYVVLPGSATGVEYSASEPSGMQLSATVVVYAGDYEIREDEKEALKYLANYYNTYTEYEVGTYVAYNGRTYKCITDTSGEWNDSCWKKIIDDDARTMFAFNTVRGTARADFFVLDYHNTDDDEITTYYYVVSTTNPNGWSEPILITGGIPLATEDQIGGFYNASTDTEYADAGYVYLDDTGHLKLVDYELLRSGALAYQLGADFTLPANQTLDEIQNYLDEFVNARVAFKTNAELSSTPTMINVYIPLPEEEGTLNIYNLDSRFGTGVYLHFITDNTSGTYSNIVINISDCEKIRIDSSITMIPNGPMINIFRSCLYYDASVINYITDCDKSNKREDMFSAYTDFTGFDNLTLWYSRFLNSDPDLIVNGMEISQPNVAMTTEEVSFWDETISGDNHYAYALRSITLSGSGKLIGCSMYVANTSTVTEMPVDATSKHIIIGGDFVLPQGSALNYPMACVKEPIQITGTFTTAYMNDAHTQWIVTETIFTAKSGVYDPATGMGNGSINFNSTTDLLDTTYTHGITTLDGWEPDSFHIFYGGTTV